MQLAAHERCKAHNYHRRQETARRRASGGTGRRSASAVCRSQNLAGDPPRPRALRAFEEFFFSRARDVYTRYDFARMNDNEFGQTFEFWTAGMSAIGT
jgi:hypothetical protein